MIGTCEGWSIGDILLVKKPAGTTPTGDVRQQTFCLAVGLAVFQDDEDDGSVSWVESS